MINNQIEISNRGKIRTIYVCSKLSKTQVFPTNISPIITAVEGGRDNMTTILMPRNLKAGI